MGHRGCQVGIFALAWHFNKMPSDQSTWLIAVPQDGDSDGLHQELETKFQNQLRTFDRKNLTQLNIPSFKVLNIHSVSAALGLIGFMNLSSLVYFLLYLRQEHLMGLSAFQKI